MDVTTDVEVQRKTRILCSGTEANAFTAVMWLEEKEATSDFLWQLVATGKNQATRSSLKLMGNY